MTSSAIPFQVSFSSGLRVVLTLEGGQTGFFQEKFIVTSYPYYNAKYVRVVSFQVCN